MKHLQYFKFVFAALVLAVIYKAIAVSFLLSLCVGVERSNSEFEYDSLLDEHCFLFLQLREKGIDVKTSQCLDLYGDKLIKKGLGRFLIEKKYHNHIARVAEYEYFKENLNMTLLKIFLAMDYQPTKMDHDPGFYRECEGLDGKPLTVFHKYPHALWTHKGYVFVPEAIQILKTCKEVEY